MTETAVKVNKLTKQYPGTLALDNISVEFPKDRLQD
jgi:ABC-type uncharacterized transport system ATPase subunit